MKTDRELLGLSRPSARGQNRAAMCRSPAVQPMMEVNDRFAVR
jgi:hypothetical protein